MYDFVIILGLIFIGAVFGSFAGAQVWRLRAGQLAEDKKAGEKIDTKEFNRLKKLTGSKLSSDRSQCLHCSYQLRWFDLIPIFSWLYLGGKCRSCRKPIGKFELIIELGLVIFFVASYIFWPTELNSLTTVAQFVIWLAAGVVMVIMFAYDAKWFLLPDLTSMIFAALGVLFVGVGAVGSDWLSVSLSALLAPAIMSGFYLVLYLFSRGAWIGFGDVKLGVGLGLFLGSWELALISLFLANLFGVLYILPGLMSGKIKRTDHVPFGPFLILGMIVTFFAGWGILDWYSSFLVF